MTLEEACDWMEAVTGWHVASALRTEYGYQIVVTGDDPASGKTIILYMRYPKDFESDSEKI